ncbi:MAG: response regulator transcription factor [Lachnospiraceae bacterium]
MFAILVVEDDRTLNRMIELKLQQENYRVFTSFDGVEALSAMEHHHVDLIICDLMMPNMNGLELIKALRESRNHLPVLMITAKDQMEDMESGFAAGSDDYMIKPVRMKELLLRVGALLRRVKIENEKQLRINQAVLDYQTLSVEIRGDHFELPPKEFYLLFKLLSNPNKIFTRLDLMDEIWGMENDSDERTVDTHIKKLRRKFEGYPDFELQTIRGIGYRGKVSDGSKPREP